MRTYFDRFAVEHIPKEITRLKGTGCLGYTNLFSPNEYKKMTK